jgi:ubiquitin carboxyl-terminal hydrolase 48
MQVIRKLLKRDPLLTFALQKALRFLRAGESQPVSHVTPDPSGQTSTLFGMRITPCLWEDGNLKPSGSTRSSQGLPPQPALLVEHNMPYNAAEVMPRLM